MNTYRDWRWEGGRGILIVYILCSRYPEALFFFFQFIFSIFDLLFMYKSIRSIKINILHNVSNYNQCCYYFNPIKVIN